MFEKQLYIPLESFTGLHSSALLLKPLLVAGFRR